MPKKKELYEVIAFTTTRITNTNKDNNLGLPSFG